MECSTSSLRVFLDPAPYVDSVKEIDSRCGGSIKDKSLPHVPSLSRELHSNIFSTRKTNRTAQKTPTPASVGQVSGTGEISVHHAFFSFFQKSEVTILTFYISVKIHS